MRTDNLERDVGEAARGVTPEWSDSRMGLALERLNLRRRRRSVVRATVAVVACVTVAVASVVLFYRGGVVAPNAVAISREGIGELRLSDGSVADLMNENSAVTVQEITAEGKTIARLSSGRVRFNVVRKPSRIFVVQAGTISVEVLGTMFTVERKAGDVLVSVERGRVRVVRDGRQTELAAGELGRFSETGAEFRVGGQLQVRDVAVAMAERPVPPREETRAKAAAAVLEAEKGWKSLAQEGLFEQAYAMLHRLPSEDLPSDIGDLMLLADVARLASHPQEAVAPLKKVVAGSPSDPRAPLAAFTLGRVLLDELGDPRQAASAFGRALSLDPEGPMAQDALAREVEAWSRAGEPVVAHEKAMEYLRKYPDGRRTGLVKRYGGVD